MEEVEHPFAELIGFQVTERHNGQCETVLEIEDNHRNPHGVVHGAVIYALADTGMGGALTSTLREGQICSTIEIKINYLRPGIKGKLRCQTGIVSQGKRTAVLESDVFDDQERLLARAMGTFMILEKG
jgi:acyl-CoA thioesterase